VNWLQIILRFVHIGAGATWVGMMTFTTFFLAPAMGDVGPESGKIMAALTKRKLLTVMPLLAVLTIVSGLWLFARFSNMQPGVMNSPMGMTLGIGGAAAIIAFVLGLVLVRPAMDKSAAAAQAGNMTESAKWRDRGSAVSTWVARLLYLALGAMAIARYV
jgi:hypothetical protein